MPTEKQRRAVDKMVENGGVASRAMIEVGYSPATAVNPNKLTESKGFKEIYAQMGLTPGFITRALKDDIEAKPKRRFQELNLAAEIVGMKKQSDGSNESPGIVVNILQNYEALGGAAGETLEAA